MSGEYEVIFCIVNAGFSDTVMDAAKEAGARGGTVIHARGTANKEAESYFQITIQPDKEIVMILVPAKIKDNVLHALYREAGLKSAGQGIAFSLPVDEVAGLSAPVEEKKQETAPEVPTAKAAPEEKTDAPLNEVAPEADNKEESK